MFNGLETLKVEESLLFLCVNAGMSHYNEDAALNLPELREFIAALQKAEAEIASRVEPYRCQHCGLLGGH